jgi:anti-anti-sigma factor
MHGRSLRSWRCGVLDIQVERRGALVIVRPVGEIDAFTVVAFRESLGELRAGQDVVIALSQVPFLDSAGLGALIAAARRIREAGGQVAMVSTDPTVTRLLRLTQFDRIVLVSESVEEAVAALVGSPREIEIALYLDTESEVVVEQVTRAADQLAAYMGYGHPADSRIGQG